ncbi:MAG: RDD family protein [Terrimesophilobacter sp.]
MSQNDVPTSDFIDTSEDDLMIGEAVALDVQPTNFVLRACGAIIDFFVYLGLWVVTILFLASPAVSQFFTGAMFQATVLASLVFCIVVVPTTVELVTRGRSLGKLAVGARIVRDDGGAIGFRHAFTRALLGVLEIYMSFGGFAALVALFNPKAKRLGDLVAGTYSQNERITRYTAPTYGVPLQLTEWAKTADVAKMPDRTARRISQFLAHATGFTPQSRASTAHSLAQEASPYVSPIPAGDPEMFLAALTAVRREREFAALQQERGRLQKLAPSLGRTPREFPTRTRP